MNWRIKNHLGTRPPGGWIFTEGGWSNPAPMDASFGETVQRIQAFRAGNNLPIGNAEQDLHNFTADRLKYHIRYVDAVDNDAKKKEVSLSEVAQPAPVVKGIWDRLKHDATGLATYVEWIGDGMNPVARLVAESRAATCNRGFGGNTCPHNRPPQNVEARIADKILAHDSLRKSLGMTVQNELSLRSCDLCGCPLRLKIWKPEVPLIEDAPNWCWAKAVNVSLETAQFQAMTASDPLTLEQQTDWPSGIFQFPSVQPGESFFNPGMAGGYLFARNDCGNRRTIARFKLGSDMALSDRTMFSPRMEHLAEQFEDPRAFVDNLGNLCISAATYVNPQVAIQQIVCKVNENFQATRNIRIRHGKNSDQLTAQRGLEKNWTFFTHEGKMFFVYQIDKRFGHEVVALDLNWRPESRNNTTGIHWRFGEIRGGTPPVLVGTEYFAFYHSSLKWGSSNSRYVMGAYAFEAEPPFRITRFTKFPILSGCSGSAQIKPVVFPSGAEIREGVWTVVYGINDNQCGWSKIPHSEVTALMIFV